MRKMTTHTELMAPIIDEIVLTESEALLALGSGFDIFYIILSLERKNGSNVVFVMHARRTAGLFWFLMTVKTAVTDRTRLDSMRSWNTIDCSNWCDIATSFLFNGKDYVRVAPSDANPFCLREAWASLKAALFLVVSSSCGDWLHLR